MELSNCRRCGKLFVSTGGGLCPDCLAELDEQYKVVRDYIYEHPEATVLEVSEATGVDEKTILAFLKEGRLELKEPGLGLECERCGKPITTGRFCSNCLKEIEYNMKEGLTPNLDVKNRRSEDRLFIAERVIKKKGKQGHRS